MLDPYRALFSPLKVLYDTKFGPKHHMMVQMANVYKIDITDPFLDLWSLPGGPQRAINMSEIGSDLVHNTPSGWPPQVERILYPIHAFFGPSGVPERLYLFT